MKKSFIFCILISISICFCACTGNKITETNKVLDEYNFSTQDMAKKTFANFSLSIPIDWSEKRQSENDFYYYYADSSNFLMVGTSDYSDSYIPRISETLANECLKGMEASGMVITGEKELATTKNNNIIGYKTAFEYSSEGVEYSGICFVFTSKGYMNQIGFFGEKQNSNYYQKIFDKIIDSIDIVELPEKEYNETPNKSKDMNQVYNDGQYKIGVDMPAGEYLLITEDMERGYFCVSSDANSKEIIVNDNFSNNSIITVSNEQYLELSRCYAIPFDEAPNICEGKTIISEGMYKIGYHIPSGEYKITSTDQFGYYCIYSDSTHSKIISNDNFKGSRYVTVEDGEYLVLNRCSLSLE